MEINATIFAQLLHFILAYYVLRRFFLQSAFASLRAEQEEERALISDIEVGRNEVTNKESVKAALWRELQKEFEQQKPKLSLWRPIPEKVVRVPRSVEVATKEEQSSALLVRELSSLLVDTIRGKYV